MLQLRPESTGAQVLPRADERDLALAQLPRHVAKGSCRVTVAHVVGITAGSEVHPDSIRTPHADAGVRDLQHQAGTVLNGAAVFVGASVGAVLQELVE